METNLLIGNFISMSAAICTFISSLSKQKQRIYLFQVLQCFLLAIASFFFDSYAGIITLLLCAIRNILLSLDKYNKYICILTAVCMLSLGLLFNNRGYVGLIVIAANVIYTVGTYFAQKEPAIKFNMILNLTLWIIYEIFILDIPSLISDVIAVVLAVISLFIKPHDTKK